MSAQSLVYLYRQRQLVVLLESANATRRYEKVYAKELTINRGVDNLIEFAVVNQEQKPVNILNKEITLRIIDSTGKKILLQKALTPLLPITGLTSLQVSATELENIQPQQCFYSLEIPIGSFDYPIFVDANSGARGVVNIVNSVLPSFVVAETVTIPSHLSPLTNDPKTYYSSQIVTLGKPVITVQQWYDNFTGSVQFQGSTVQDFSIFYDIDTPMVFLAYTGTTGTTVSGFHPYIRLKIINDGTEPVDINGELLGDVTALLSR